jgi:uncharacterized protein (DUF983 family)
MTNPVSLGLAMWRGFKMKCPHCGEGHLFGRFLKVVDHCDACGESYSAQRADDLPAYLVIVIVGHAVVPALLALETAYAPPYWLHALIWLPITLISSLALLQPVKGSVVGLQWQIGMHGFQESKRRRAAEEQRLAQVSI